MNWLRRLFGRSTAPQSNGALSTSPGAPADTGESEPAVDVAPANNTPAAQSAAPQPAPVADGATRPLPPEQFLEPTMAQHIVFAQATDVGMVRTNNQDAAVAFYSTARSVEERPDFGLFAVADGMGGHHDGEKASALSLQTFTLAVMSSLFLPLLGSGADQEDTPISELLTDAVRQANATVLEQVPDGGTTLTAVTVVGDLAYVSHVGDSRVYLITGDQIEQVTRDHSLVQRLVELDQITVSEAADHPQKNVLYRAIGQNETLDVDLVTRRLVPYSRLLICSDGLWNVVDNRELREIVMKNPTPQMACDQLIALANARGGADNITVILLHIPG